MEPRIGLLGGNSLIAFMFASRLMNDLDDVTVYKNNRKPNPNAHRVKFNRCPRKLKKAIKNSIHKDEIKEFNILETRDVIDKLWKYYDETSSIYYLMKGIIIQKGKIKPIVKDIRHQVVRIGIN